MSWKEDLDLLEKNGWEVECESPFEIRHSDSESFATNDAAMLILNSLKTEGDKERECIEEITINYFMYINSDFKLDIDTKFNFGELGLLTPRELIAKFYYIFKNEGMF